MILIPKSNATLPFVITDFSTYAAVLLDLDGTVYYEEHPLPGAVEFIQKLRNTGISFACLSNSTTSPARIKDRLSAMGVEMEVERIYSAAAAAADYVMHHFQRKPRPRIFNLATEGVQELLDGKVDWVASDAEPCDAVIIGAPSNEMVSEPRQRLALSLLRKGAAAIGVCADRLYPSPRGFEFGSGAHTMLLTYAA